MDYIFLGLPATILIIKIVLGYVFSSERVEKQSYTNFKLKRALEKKYNCSNFYNFHDYDVFIDFDMEKSYCKKLSQKEVNGKYPILDDTGSQTGKYLEPININQMYRSFLKICQNEEEITR